MHLDYIFQKKRFLLALLGLFTAQIALAQEVVRYDLYLNDTTVQFSGKEKRAIAANGQIPMPTLTFTEGDTAEIVVHNQLREGTSIHWHGVQLPNEHDGVPFLTQLPIEPGSSHTYRFVVRQNGTYWYHSHAGFQEQLGMYGSLVFLKRADDPDFRKDIDDLPAVSLTLSEWTDIKPHQVQRLLATGTDWFGIKKNTIQSYGEAIRKGHFKTKIINEWKRMHAMDVSDVYYDAFLINGQVQSEMPQFKGGDKVRLRIANAGGSSYFWLSYAGGKYTVVANDGNDVEPVEVDRLIIGVSETYDIVVTLPEDGRAYELLATPEDRSGCASLFLGKGEKEFASVLPRLDYFEGMQMMNDMMKMNGDLDDMGMDMGLQKMDMNTVMYRELSEGNKQDMNHSKGDMHKDMDHSQHGMDKEMDHSQHGMDHSQHSMDSTSQDDHSQHTMPSGKIETLNYSMLKSTHVTRLNPDAPVKELRFELTGNMNRYVWSMDNRVLSEVDKIQVKKGEVLRITLYNNSMMRHPMHLHGFDFRLINGQGDYAPLMNVMDIMPMETNVIEFEANTEGDWFFHCHILYHMMAGMNRVFEVDDYDNPLIPDKAKAYNHLQSESNMVHFSANNDFASNGNDGAAMLQNTRWSLGAEWRLGYNDENGYEVETHLGRYIGKMQWLMPFVGFDWRYRQMGRDEREENLFGQANTKDTRRAVSVGVLYTLPMLVNFQAEVYHDGIVRLTLAREDIPISRRLRAGFMVNTDMEYTAGIHYIVTRHLGIRAHYDSDMGFGLGLRLNY